LPKDASNESDIETPGIKINNKRKRFFEDDYDEEEEEQQAERVDRHTIIQAAREEPAVATNVQLRPIEPPSSELLERFHRFYKPGEDQTNGPLQPELNEMWKSGPGKCFFQIPNPVTKWQCHFCFFSYPSQYILKNHLFDRYGLNTFATHCPHCNCNYESDASLKLHTSGHYHDKPVFPLEDIKTQNRPGLTEYPCVSCNSKFTIRNCYMQHYEDYHTGRRVARIKQENYACTYNGCKRICPDEKTLNIHIGHAHSTYGRNAKLTAQQRDSYKFKCDNLDCNQVFMTQASLMQHQFMNHASHKK
jgi:hypothetical protein